MGTTQSNADADEGAGPAGTVRAEPEGIREIIADSVLLKIAIFGGLTVLLGAFLDTGVLVPRGGLWGIWSAVFAVWGAGLITAGLGGYLFVWWRRRT